MYIKNNRSNLAIGAILIGAGALLLLGQAFDFMRWDLFWPFIIIGLGATFFAGMALGGKSTAPLAIPGSIISMVGLILFLQNTFGWWESWSYAWALIVVAVGLGIAISGWWSGNSVTVKDGLKVTRVGLTLFVVFAFIFEILFSVTGVSSRPALFWAYLVAALGLLMLISRLYRILAQQEAEDTDRNDLFWPILFLGIGGLVILSDMNLMPEFNPLSLLRLWPLLLIAAGVQLIFGRRNAWVSGGLGLVVLATLVGFIFYGAQLGFNTTNPWSFATVNIGPGERIQGSGVISEQVRSISGVEKVEVESAGVLTIIQGNEEKLVVVAEQNIQQYIVTRVQGNTLYIDTESGFSFSLRKPIEFVLTVKNLEEVDISGAAEVRIPALETEELTLTSSGLGSFQIDNLFATQLEVNIGGTGNIHAAGRVDDLYINISGMGSFKGEDLEAESAYVNVSGLGGATLWVNQSLRTNISGAGNISYYGTPEVDNQSSGVGSVRSLGDK